MEGKTVNWKAKPSIEEAKPSIGARREIFYQAICRFDDSLNSLMTIFNALCNAEFFSRKDIMTVCNIQVTSAGDLLSKLKTGGVIEPVSGHGKGKYRFIV